MFSLMTPQCAMLDQANGLYSLIFSQVQPEILLMLLAIPI